MPFTSSKQARFLAINHPEVFKKFIKHSGGKVKIKKNEANFSRGKNNG